MKKQYIRVKTYALLLGALSLGFLTACIVDVEIFAKVFLQEYSTSLEQTVFQLLKNIFVYLSIVGLNHIFLGTWGWLFVGMVLLLFAVILYFKEAILKN